MTSLTEPKTWEEAKGLLSQLEDLIDVLDNENVRHYEDETFYNNLEYYWRNLLTLTEDQQKCLDLVEEYEGNIEEAYNNYEGDASTFANALKKTDKYDSENFFKNRQHEKDEVHLKKMIRLTLAKLEVVPMDYLVHSASEKLNRALNLLEDDFWAPNDEGTINEATSDAVRELIQGAISNVCILCDHYQVKSGYILPRMHHLNTGTCAHELLELVRRLCRDAKITPPLQHLQLETNNVKVD